MINGWGTDYEVFNSLGTMRAMAANAHAELINEMILKDV